MTKVNWFRSVLAYLLLICLFLPLSLSAEVCKQIQSTSYPISPINDSIHIISGVECDSVMLFKANVDVAGGSHIVYLDGSKEDLDELNNEMSYIKWKSYCNILPTDNYNEIIVDKIYSLIESAISIYNSRCNKCISSSMGDRMAGAVIPWYSIYRICKDTVFEPTLDCSICKDQVNIFISTITNVRDIKGIVKEFAIYYFEDICHKISKRNGFNYNNLHIKLVDDIVKLEAIKYLKKEIEIEILLAFADYSKISLAKNLLLYEKEQKLSSIFKYTKVLKDRKIASASERYANAESHIINQKNMSLAGKTHPISGVPFDANGFPVFKSYIDIELPPSLHMTTDKEQFAYATKKLFEAVQKDDRFASKFSEKQLEQIKNGIKPSGYTWHHHQDAGKLQLVDTNIHQSTGHTGGKSMWGGGTENR